MDASTLSKPAQASPAIDPGAMLASAPGLAAVVATAELARRATRPPQHALENDALLRVMDALATDPEAILQVLADTILGACRAGSAGISLADDAERASAAGTRTGLGAGGTAACFRWRAVSGELAASERSAAAQPHVLSRLAIELDPGGVQLFRRPASAHPQFDALGVPVEEVLMTPFTAGERPVGTVWAVQHRTDRHFDREDARLLARLSRAAAVAWRQHAATLALRESEAHARHTVELNPQVPWTADAQGRILDFSERWLTLTGMTREEALGAGWTEAPHPEDFPAMSAEWHRCLASGDTYDVEHRIRVADGSYRWVHTTARPRRDAQGRIVRWYGSTEDVDDRKRAEQALLEQQTETALALEATGVGVFRYDVGTRRLAFSPHLKRIWGMAPETVPDPVQVVAQVHPDDRGLLQAVRDSLSPQAGGEFSLELRIFTAAGEPRWIQARGHTEFTCDDPGTRRALRSVGTVVDVTDRRRAEQQLLASEKRFATLVASLPQLAWSSRADGSTDYFSPQWLDYTGQTPAQAEGFGWRATVHPDDLAAMAQAREAAFAGDGVFTSELRIRDRTGRYRWFLARATAMRDERGAIVRWYGTCTDIDLARNVQDELARREAQLDLATRIAGAGIFDHDYLTGTLWWSDRLREIHQLPRDVEPSLHVLGVQMLPEDNPQHMAAVAAAGDPAGSGAFVSEFRIRRPDGELRWILARARTFFAVVDGQRRPVRTVGVELDITEQKNIEAALRESERRFVALADSVPALVWTTSPEGPCDYLNRRWYEYTGQAPAEATGFGWLAAVHPDDREPVGALWTRSLRSGEPFETEYRLRRHDGAYRWFSARANPQRDASGAIDRWIGSSSDIDEIRRLITASERAADRLRLATEAAQLGIIEYFMDGAIHWDERARSLWGLAPDAPLSADYFMSRINPEDRALVQASIDRVLDPTRSSGRYEAEYRVAGQHGVEHWVRATGSVRFADGRPHHVIGTVQDISAQKAIEAQLRAADRRKDEFLATLAHELRNPLAPIRNAAQILASPKLDDRALQWSRQVIQRQVTHMAWLLEDLLDVARITQGKLELRRERIVLSTVVETAVEAARPLIDGKRHVLAIELPVPDVEIDADPLRLAQVISNLLTNAAKYTDAGGRIALTAQLAPPNLRIAVRDSGIGIAPAALHSIFEMFSQVADTLHRSEGGLGIGLALVKGLVDLHGGSIEARSDGPGRGSEFIVHLPLPIGSRGAGDEPDARLAAAAPRSGRRVLVADDNRDAADSLGLILGMSGHEVRVAHGGREALAAAATFDPEVVLLDIGMPDMNGYDVARALRAAPGGGQLQLIALTGWGHPDDKRRAAEAGFDRHLTKPVDPAELEALLRAPPGQDGTAGPRG
ncbi:MAG: PAS domain-containing protein [Steroidobacteraceae bacterium]|jgi:PAS domain S-box-containing protein|nr:PAS domain-containing protein [Steroidobacteraceae bacterium]